jgi:hypothetical protein
MTYAPSGRFSALLWPLFAAAAAVAAAMAYVLYPAEAHNLYYYFLAPFIIGIPVMLAAAAVVHYGKCRSVWIASIISAAITLVFYVGYWQISYLHFANAAGRVAPLILQLQTGHTGLPGYFLFRCQVTKPTGNHYDRDKDRRPPTAADNVFNYVFFGGEAAVLAFVGFGIGAALARRAFFEPQERWASSFSFQFAQKDLAPATAAIANQDWISLAGLPKLSHDAMNPNSAPCRVKIEYLRGDPLAGVYLTAWLGNAGKSMSGAMRLLDRVNTGTIRQRLITGESAARVHAAFPTETKFTGVITPGNTARQTVIPPLPTAADPAAARDALCLPAGASIAYSPDAVCQSVDPAALKGIRRFDLGYTLWMVGTLGLTMSAAIAALSTSDRDSHTPMTTPQIILFSIFAVGMVSMTVVILFFHRLRYALIRRRLAARPGSLLALAGGVRKQGFKIYFASQFHLKEKAIDDVAIVAVDPRTRRLFIEGIRYRYSIPAAAIQAIQPIQSDSTLALQLDIAMKSTTLSLVLARDNSKGHWQHHLWFLSTAKDAQKVANRLRVDLGLPKL